MKVKRRFAAFLAAAMVLCVCGFAAGENPPSGEMNVFRMMTPGPGDSGVAYPLFSFAGGNEAAVRINADVFASARVGEYLSMLSALSEGGTGLRMDYLIFPETPAEWADTGVLSVVMYAKGRMPEGRPSQRWYPMVFDAATGERITAEDVFADVDGARDAVESYLCDKVEGTLSDYLENRELVPVPMDSFALCGRGIIYYYAYDALCFLSGWAGEVLIPYSVLEGYLASDPSSPAVRLMENERRDTDVKIFSALEGGGLPGFPVNLGEDLDAALERLRTGIDPAWWPGGAAYETEDARMRGALMISLDGSGIVDALAVTEGEVCALRIGDTFRETWRRTLGIPEETLTGADTPLYAALGAGDYDIYRRGDRLLILCAGEDGKLGSVLIANTEKGFLE